ncbi:MAG: hypothetical protein ACTS2F_02070 [Thainema sp.]
MRQLTQTVRQSQKTGSFQPPSHLPNNEIQFLAETFSTVFKELESYLQLQLEITRRKEIETELRDSEANERRKSEQLEKTLAELRQAQAQLVQSDRRKLNWCRPRKCPVWVNWSPG